MRSDPSLRSGAAVCFMCLRLLSLASVSTADGIARAATWASTPVGPDGPWNVVKISLGRSSQSLSLFPGHQWQILVPTSDYCSLNSSINHCDAGTYSKDKAIESKFGGIKFKTPVQHGTLGIPMAGPDLQIFYDDCDVVGPVPNCSMALVDTQMLRYPSGKLYPLFAGCLALGAPKVNQTYTQPGQPSINASIYPWWLQRIGTIPSSSFGMHIGSAAANAAMSGSLNFGGYDKNRIVGDILTSKGHFTDNVQLTDVAIKSIKGKSPFDFQTKTGLLAAGNSSIPSTGVNVSLDACSPYLTLPKSTCDAIASHLPVTFNSSLGLYLWNTNDAKYKGIIGSASALSFSITSAGNKKPITINVPFQHLNLTLTVPLLVSDAQYFPCFTGDPGAFVLGRAFMQDVFLGASYDNSLWWLAQAPGPDIPSNPNVVNLASSDESVSASGTEWASTWDRVWSASASDAKPSPSPSPETSSTSQFSPGLSTGEKVGIGVGVGVALLVLAAAGALFWHKTRRSKLSQESHTVSDESNSYSQAITEAYAPNPPPGRIYSS
ncbi:hypothetical protein ED733_004741 [Metarhizium rileyi]|uniref:Peptidase A1 domain-containing protein n=1 Tax=Metarhizium rileyi (strain RCEF 4871) TaxID=1649241 RepID=A0A5C6GER1_METRR|nr:hypothetical protein ED733_004741 [Metarhizium rileyi]